jgi:hypothetical protein
METSMSNSKPDNTTMKAKAIKPKKIKIIKF